MSNSYKYVLATRGNVILCIKYTDNCAVELIDRLVDKGWNMQISDKDTYDSQLINGGRIQTRCFDANTNIDI
jgi:hypothetical protein